MRIGVVSAMLRWLPSIEAQIAWTEAAGFDAIEMSCWHSAPPEFDGLWARRKVSPREVAAVLAPRLTGVPERHLHASFFHAYDPTFATFHPLFREAAIDEAAYALELAAALGVKVVTVHPNGFVHGRGERERRASFVDAVERLERLAEQHGVRVGLEAIQYLLPLQRCDALLRDLGLRWVGLTLDLGHAHLRCVAPPLCMVPFGGRAYDAYGSVAGFISAMASSIVHVHLHDCDGATSHLPIGEGDAALRDCVHALVRHGYAGTVSIEAEGDEAAQARYLRTVRGWVADAT